MKYLKKFENLDYFSDGVYEIEKFIKDNLAYILDDGFTYKVNFKRYNGKFNYKVLIHKIEQIGNNRKQKIFYWESVKDDFIPFFELLNDKYTLESYSPEDNSLVIDSGDTVVFNGKEWIGGNEKRWYSIEELIDDTVGDIKFQFICFTITSGYMTN